MLKEVKFRVKPCLFNPVLSVIKGVYEAVKGFFFLRQNPEERIKWSDMFQILNRGCFTFSFECLLLLQKHTFTYQL